MEGDADSDRDDGTWHHFPNAYSAAPVCGPSRTSFLLGLYASTTNLYTNKPLGREYMPPALRQWKSLPQIFSDAGRRTAAIGKVFHGASFPGEFEYETKVFTEKHADLFHEKLRQ